MSQILLYVIIVNFYIIYAIISDINMAYQNRTEQNRTLYLIFCRPGDPRYHDGPPTYYKLVTQAVMFLIIKLYISYADIIILARIHRNVAKNEVRYRL